MEKKFNKKTSLIFWWIILTVIYSISLGLGGGYIAAISGLFTPIGPLGFYGFFISPLRFIIAVIIVLFTVIKFNKIIKNWNASDHKKILTILFILLVLTMIIDILIYGKWMSIGFLGNGGDYSF